MPTIELTRAPSTRSPARARRNVTLAVAALSVLLALSAEMTIPTTIGWAVDLASQQKLSHSAVLTGPNGFTLLAATLLSLLLVQYLGQAVSRQILGGRSLSVAADLKQMAWSRARFYPSSFFGSNRSLFNVVAVDARAASLLSGTLWLNGLFMAGTALFAVSFLFTIQSSLTLIYLALSLGLFFLTRYSGNKQKMAFHRYQEQLASLANVCRETLQTIRLQRQLGAWDFWAIRVRTQNRRCELTSLAAKKKVVALELSTLSFTWLSFAVILGLSIHKLFTGELTLGNFIAFSTYLGMLSSSIIQSSQFIAGLQKAGASQQRVQAVLKSPTSTLFGGTKTLPVKIRASYCVSELTLPAFGSTDVPNKLNLETEPGEHIAVTGSVGSGKSLLLKVLAGVETDYTGKILFCGEDIRDIDHFSLRQKIAYVPGNAFLFADTIRNNLAFNRPVIDSELWFFLEVVEMAGEVRKMKDGLRARLGEGGTSLSGGQKQRLALARALLRRPTVLLLDDALNAVDRETESKIIAHLEMITRGTTIFWASRSPLVSRYCQREIHLPPARAHRIPARRSPMDTGRAAWN